MDRFVAERRRRINLLKLRRRRIRDFNDPFDVTEQAFIGSYRLTQDLVRSLVDLIRPHMRRTTSPLAVSLEIKVRCFIKVLYVCEFAIKQSLNFLIAVFFYFRFCVCYIFWRLDHIRDHLGKVLTQLLLSQRSLIMLLKSLMP